MKKISLVAALVALLLLVNSVFIVRESQVALLFQFGRIQRADIGPGLHFKLPMLQNAKVFDRRILTLDAPAERYLTSEKKDVNVDFFAKWRVKDVRLFYTTTLGDELGATQRLAPILMEALRNQISQRTLRETVSDARSSVTQKLVAQANDAAKTLGIEIIDVRIKRIELPEEVSESVYNRMRAERSRVATQLRSQGTEASEAIKANANRERQVVLAEAERDAQRLRGEGDAEAAGIYAEAYSADPEFYAFHRSLEAYRRSFADGDAVLVLDPDTEFFRYFENGGRGE